MNGGEVLTDAPPPTEPPATTTSSRQSAPLTPGRSRARLLAVGSRIFKLDNNNNNNENEDEEGDPSSPTPRRQQQRDRSRSRPRFRSKSRTRSKSRNRSKSLGRFGFGGGKNKDSGGLGDDSESGHVRDASQSQYEDFTNVADDGMSEDFSPSPHPSERSTTSSTGSGKKKSMRVNKDMLQKLQQTHGVDAEKLARVSAARKSSSSSATSPMRIRVRASMTTASNHSKESSSLDGSSHSTKSQHRGTHRSHRDNNSSGLQATPGRKKKTIRAINLTQEGLESLGLAGALRSSTSSSCGTPSDGSLPLTPGSNHGGGGCGSNHNTTNKVISRISVGDIKNMLMRTSMADHHNEREHSTSTDGADTIESSGSHHHRSHSPAPPPTPVADQPWDNEEEHKQAIEAVQKAIQVQEERCLELQRNVERNTQFVAARLESNNRIGVLVSMKQIFKFQAVQQQAQLAVTHLQELQADLEARDTKLLDLQGRIEGIVSTTTQQHQLLPKLSEDAILQMAQELVAKAATATEAASSQSKRGT